MTTPVALTLNTSASSSKPVVFAKDVMKEAEPNEDAFDFLARFTSSRDPRLTSKSRELYCKILGNANEYKEGDETVGVAAPDQKCRDAARRLLENTKVGEIHEFSLNADRILDLCKEIDLESFAKIQNSTIGGLKRLILGENTKEEDIRPILPGLSSDVVACIVKVMTNDELCVLGSRIFNPLPNSKVGAKGYFGARVQPNSPTDDPEDIFWQCLNAFSFAVGDVMLGTNPVSSDPDSVLGIEKILKHVVEVFGIAKILPFTVLAHVDIQAQVEKNQPGSTSLWFQSIAGSDSANQTFDLPVAKMLKHASTRTGKFGLYLETGQGADFTNGHAKGMDMVMHDARKYGFARALGNRVGQAQFEAGNERAPYIFVNDVSGFIGPEVFRSKEQLVRICLEDIALGKLHGLTIGLDVCATLHMDVSLDDLDWCYDHIMPACPSWAMALPTKNDPMLSYLTTAFQDHVRLREKFKLKVNDEMWNFFANELQVVDLKSGQPTEHFGDPAWVFLKFARKRGDSRPDEVILNEANTRIRAVQAKGVPIAIKYGAKPWNLNADLDKEMRRLYDDAKTTLWHSFTPEFLKSVPNPVFLKTQSQTREDFVFHPETGEKLSNASMQDLLSRANQFKNFVVLISDGLCADALMDYGHLPPFLARLRECLSTTLFYLPSINLVMESGRVRVGYQIGEVVFQADCNADDATLDAPCGLCHIIGERPGSGHHTFSAYLTVATRRTWSQRPSTVDHDISRVVSGIADTSYDPCKAANEAAAILGSQVRALVSFEPPPVSPPPAVSFSRPQKLFKMG